MLEKMTEAELFQNYRLGLLQVNIDLVKDVLREYKRRGLTTINGEPMEKIFERNPILKRWYEGEEN